MPVNDALAIGDDGAFRLEGLPPGAWQVQVACQVSRDDRVFEQVFLADRVLLADGQATKFALDLGFVIPGTLQGSAHRNGQPFANGSFSLRAERFATRVTTDPQGKFATSLIPGDYRAATFEVAEGVLTRFGAATPIHVVRGQTTSVTLEFASSTLRVRVFDSKGKPAAGVRLSVIGEASQREFITDERGVAEGEVATETVTLSTLPKALLAPEAQQRVLAEANAQGATDPFAAHQIVLRTISLTTGQTTSLEVRLPESAK